MRFDFSRHRAILQMAHLFDDKYSSSGHMNNLECLATRVCGGFDAAKMASDFAAFNPGSGGSGFASKFRRATECAFLMPVEHQS